MSRLDRLAAAALLWGLAATLAAQRPANDFSFSVVGDRAGSPEPQIYGRVLREVALLRPHFVLTSGDAIPGNRDDQLEQEWAEFKRIWAGLPWLKVFHAPGNHDIWNEKSREAFARHTGFATHYSFRYQDALFVVADTGRGDELPDAELDFIEAQLAANPDAAPKLIVFHKPFWIEKFKAGDTGFRLHAMAVRHKAAAVISGHGHRFAHMVRDGIRYLEAPSAGGSMRGKLARGEGFRQGCFYGHVLTRVDGARVYFTVREIDGLFGNGRMFDAADWDENGPKFPPEDPALQRPPAT